MKTVLVVDDEHDIANAVEMVLTMEGYQTCLAQNGKEALELLKEMPTKPDLIISDLMMPIMDGYEFVTALRANPEYRNIPLMITSAGRFDEKRLPPGGSNIFIRKPFDLDNLIAQVAGLIAQSG
jgi:two-component system response regulator VicR